MVVKDRLVVTQLGRDGPREGPQGPCGSNGAAPAPVISLYGSGERAHRGLERGRPVLLGCMPLARSAVAAHSHTLVIEFGFFLSQVLAIVEYDLKSEIWGGRGCR